jgi:hypothetical protein
MKKKEEKKKKNRASFALATSGHVTNVTSGHLHDVFELSNLFFPRRDLNSHHWYTAAPIA